MTPSQPRQAISELPVVRRDDGRVLCIACTYCGAMAPARFDETLAVLHCGKCERAIATWSNVHDNGDWKAQ